MRCVCAPPALPWAARYNTMQILLYIASSICGAGGGQQEEKGLWGDTGGFWGEKGGRWRGCEEAAMRRKYIEKENAFLVQKRVTFWCVMIGAIKAP